MNDELDCPPKYTVGRHPHFSLSLSYFQSHSRHLNWNTDLLLEFFFDFLFYLHFLFLTLTFDFLDFWHRPHQSFQNYESLFSFLMLIGGKIIWVSFFTKPNLEDVCMLSLMVKLTSKDKAGEFLSNILSEHLCYPCTAGGMPTYQFGQWFWYSQIHWALQQIPAHSTPELYLWLVSSWQGYNVTRGD